MLASRHLKPISRTTVSDEIVERLVAYILDEGLRPGAKLPSERKLMEKLQVGRSSLREAVKTLTALGIVEVEVGEGMFVGRGEISALTKPLRWGLLVSESGIHEVMEARRVAEVELAGLAAERASEEEIADIAANLEAMRSHLSDPEGYARSDLEFHLAIARAGHNGVLFRVLDTIRHILGVWIVQVVVGYEKKPSSLGEHIPIFEAIRARDKDRARQSMLAHMRASAGRVSALAATYKAKPKTV